MLQTAAPLPSVNGKRTTNVPKMADRDADEHSYVYIQEVNGTFLSTNSSLLQNT
jgi:hypothetical protein